LGYIHPARMYRLENDLLEPLMPSLEEKRRQDIPHAYFRNGSIYLTRVQVFCKNQSVMNKPIMPYIMDANWLLNIDSQRDVLLAKALMPNWIKEIAHGGT